MRVTKKWNAYQSPCNTAGYGESEDYSVNVVAASGCTGTPTAGTAVGPAQACNGIALTINLNGSTVATGIKYQWEKTTVGGSGWVPMTNDTTTVLTTTLSGAGADFRCVITCTNSSLFVNSNVVSVGLQTTNCPPLNDAVCSAITLILNGTADCQNTTYATSVADPAFTCSTPNNTTWYKYTPAATGIVQFTITPPASGDTLRGWIGVYTATGTCPGALTFTDVLTPTIVSCKSFGALAQGPVTFLANLTAATEYYFMIDGFSGDVGQYCISIQTPPVAPNCTTNISPTNLATNVPTSVTFKWNTVVGATSYDLYVGTANPPTTLLGNFITDSAVATGAAFSTVYYWYVVPKNGSVAATGCTSNITSFTTVSPPPPPSNDECTGAIAVVTGTPVSGTTISATQSQAADSCAGFLGNANDDVWFKFTANQNGDAIITETPSIGTSFDGVIIVYAGACGTLTKIGCADATVGGGVETVTVTGLNSGETYYFRIFGYGGANTEGNFTATISGTALPILLSNFRGERKGATNLINWSTISEKNNKGFELQRSATGDYFLPLTFVESQSSNGNSSSILNYQFTDTKPYSGNTFYRLKQVDINGKSSFSNIILIKGDKVLNLNISDIYPNPVNKILNMIIAAPIDENVNIIITDITGKILKKHNAQVIAGNNNIKLDVNNLASGSYLLKVICNKNCNSSIVKFIKQ